MARDIFKQSAQGEKFLQKHYRLELSIGEMHQFFDAFTTAQQERGSYAAVWETIATAYRMGIAAGARNSRRA